MEVKPLLLSKKDSARILGISVRKLDYMIAQGILKTKQIGRRCLLRYSDLLKFAGGLD